jgi:hypothetical protein
MPGSSTKLTPVVGPGVTSNDPFPHFNGAVLSIAQIIKFAMASAAEAELAALYVIA